MKKKKHFAIIGSAATLSTLGMVTVGSILGSLPLQLLPLFSNPFIAIPLLFSEGLIITVIMVSLAWLIIYCLNKTFADDPIYQKIYEAFIPPNTKAVLADIQAEIESGGADLEALRRVVEERLKARSSETDAAEMEVELQRLETRLRKLFLRRLSKA